MGFMSRLAEGWNRFNRIWSRGLKRIMPRSLFGRTLLIIVMPTVLALLIATFVFFDRHWYTMTHHLSYAVAGDVATIVELLEENDTPKGRDAVINLARDKMDLAVKFIPGGVVNDEIPRWQHGSPLRALIKRALEDRITYNYSVELIREPDEEVKIGIEIPNRGLYEIVSPARRVYTPTTTVFIAFMIGSSVILSVIALLFMRNQIRPIRHLADAAEAIGKGQDVPWFKLEGAMEVRQAGAALLVMHDRLRRQISQRTTMLAGVSHDLRTPLTRMKLQLALMPENADTQELSTDIADMENMVEAYLAFARGEESETAVPVDLADYLNEIVTVARREHPHIQLRVNEPLTITLRRNAMKRCLANLLSNALRYGRHAEVSAGRREHAIDIMVDDDGPGISHEKREAVFRPFLRLDESRNPATGGVGLGLTIARDIARFHGGDVVLEESPLGGLRARIWLPI
jgi:two-component system osmolarity sensor histidine kinase EnvZ